MPLSLQHLVQVCSNTELLLHSWHCDTGWLYIKLFLD